MFLDGRGGGAELFFEGDLGAEAGLEQEVAEFFAEAGPIVFVDRKLVF